MARWSRVAHCPEFIFEMAESGAVVTEIVTSGKRERRQGEVFTRPAFSRSGGTACLRPHHPLRSLYHGPRRPVERR